MGQRPEPGWAHAALMVGALLSQGFHSELGPSRPLLPSSSFTLGTSAEGHVSIPFTEDRWRGSLFCSLVPKVPSCCTSGFTFPFPCLLCSKK